MTQAATTAISAGLWIAIAASLAADWVLLRSYTKMTTARRDFYGAVRYYGHMLVMKVFVLSGMVGVACELTGWQKPTLLPLISQLVGLLAVAATPFTLMMAFKAYGDRSVTTSGYQLYTLFFLRSGVQALIDPTSSTAWIECWVLAHSYATCRMFTSMLWQVRNHFKEQCGDMELMQFSHKQAYNYALVMASVLVLYVAEGVESVVFYCSLSMVAQLGICVMQMVLGGGEDAKVEQEEHTFAKLYNAGTPATVT